MLLPLLLTVNHFSSLCPLLFVVFPVPCLHLSPVVCSLLLLLSISIAWVATCTPLPSTGPHTSLSSIAHCLSSPISCAHHLTSPNHIGSPIAHAGHLLLSSCGRHLLPLPCAHHLPPIPWPKHPLPLACSLEASKFGYGAMSTEPN